MISSFHFLLLHLLQLRLRPKTQVRVSKLVCKVMARARLQVAESSRSPWLSPRTVGKFQVGYRTLACELR